MLYFIYGETEPVIAKAQELVAGMRAKKPDALVVEMSAEQITSDRIIEYTQSQALFNERYIVRVSHALSTADAKKSDVKDLILESLEQLEASENIFIWTEADCDEKTLKIISDIAQKVLPYPSKISKKPAYGPGAEFNIFSLADAFGTRNKLKAWEIFLEARKKNIAAEEIHGVLFWQIKNILLAYKAKTADDAGLKPFVWSKAKTSTNYFSEKEITSISVDFVDMYHKAHRGELDFNLALEKSILSL